jgi:cystathionine beta-lyase
LPLYVPAVQPAARDTAVVPSGSAPDFDHLDLAALRRRRSAKWTRYPLDVLPVWVAEMDLPLAAPVTAALRGLVDRGDTGYPAFGGLAESYAAFSARRFGWAPDPAAVVPVPDVVRGIARVLELVTRPGDGVVVNPPVYPPFFGVVAGCGRRVVSSPLRRDGSGRFRLDVDDLERCFRLGARAYLLCHPHNPTGEVLGRAELAAVAALAQRYRVTVVSDEIHAPLTSPGHRHVPFGSLDGWAPEHAVTLVSASKAWNLAGLKCALAVPGRAVAEQVDAGFDDEIRFGCSLPGVVAAQAAFEEGEPWLDAVLGHLDGQRRLLADLLGRRLPAVGYRPPDATFLAWLDFSRAGLGADPARVLLDRGRVALSSGLPFGPGGTGWARLNFATSGELLAEAVDRMAAAVGAGAPISAPG